MRTAQTTILMVSLLALSPAVFGANTRPANPANQPTANQVESEIVGRIRAVQGQLEREEALLKQRMAQAEQLRKSGLEREDRRLLDQAEQLEKQAFAQYEQFISQFERYTTSLAAATEAAARAAAGASQPAPRPAASQNDAPPKSNTQGRLRSLLRMGGE